ncbi:MAG: hypothetical protein GQ535_01390 [Rhodobacteraceae bacterium]|nr:hypothetical protein [Paracoccaceae bacterium]
MASARTLTTIFVAKLAFDYPALRYLLEAQIESTTAEILPYGLMFDFEEIIAQMDPLEPWVEAFLQTLEENFNTEEDDPISNIIAVSFIEPLSTYPGATSLAARCLPPKLKAQFDLCSGKKK